MPSIAAWSGIAASVALSLVCLAYLADANTRELVLTSLMPDSGFIGLPRGLRWSFAALVILNLPAAAVVQFLVWGLEYFAPTLSPAGRASILVPVAVLSSLAWWLFGMRKLVRAAMEMPRKKEP